MAKEENQTSDAEGIQVFELTMDNPEDQDELNRRLRKPGEPDRNPPTNNSAPGESKTEAAEKKDRTAQG
jgi:hypothetical protein